MAIRQLQGGEEFSRPLYSIFAFGTNAASMLRPNPSFPRSLRRFPRGVHSLQPMGVFGPQRDKLLDKEIQNGRRPSFSPCRQKELGKNARYPWRQRLHLASRYPGLGVMLRKIT